MDPEKRQSLIKKIKLQGLPFENGKQPLVSLDEFFNGNDDEASIGCNLDEHPGIRIFYDTLKAIRSKPSVQDIRVAIHEVEEDDSGMWPFSDTVYILTCATESEVEEWVESLQPSEVGAGFTPEAEPNAPMLQAGMTAYWVWWD